MLLNGLISPSAGGVVSASIGVTVSLIFPPGAVDEAVLVKVEQVLNPSSLDWAQVAGHSFQITALTLSGSPVATFDPPFSLIVTYANLPLGDDVPPFLYYWNEGAGAWEKILAIHNPATHTLTAVLDHLTIFAVMQDKTVSVYIPLVSRR